MLPLNIKDEVAKVISTEWSAFARNHPHLAAVIDTSVLIEQAVALLEDDPEYAQSMEQAAVAGLAADTLNSLIGRFVRQFLSKLLA